MSDVLAGLRVLDLSRGLSGALFSLVLADYGAEVLHVESPAGDPLRRHPAFPLWGRGKKSVVLDLRSDDGRYAARRLAESADVLVETFRPGVVERLGLAYSDLATVNPGLVHTSITGFGRRGPYAHLKGYEGIVMAKLGAMRHVEGMAPRSGPAFPAVPYASFSAAHTALHGTLAALYLRERTGRGQKVDTSLVQAIATHDPWDWFLRIIAERYPAAFRPAPPYSERLVPTQSFAFRLLVCLTRDGRWLQFSQISPHLFAEFMCVLGLDWMWDHPEWKTAPEFEEEEKRERFWEYLLEAARQRTVAEWDEVFRSHPNVWAELFRTTEELLEHPQMQHNGQVVEVVDHEVGRTRQLAPLVRMTKTPGQVRAPAARLGEHTEAVLRSLEQDAPAFSKDEKSEANEQGGEAKPRHGEAAKRPNGVLQRLAEERASTSGQAAAQPRQPPLRGVTILELGLWYAAPYGAALLADLGARVIKIEPLAGEPMRNVMPFPEAGAIKVLQGKESVALALDQPASREVIRRLARRADLVLTSYRAGVAGKHGVDEETLRRENPRLIYLNAPGYGVDGPCARKPAYAPTIGVASGAALYQAGPSIPHGPALRLEEIKPASIRLNYAAQAPGNADGCSALGVATALLLGLLARERTGAAQEMFTSMLCTTAYAVSDDALSYAGKPERSGPDRELYGLSALYRLYETSAGWIFLAAPAASEWPVLCTALRAHVDLTADARFATPAGRRDADAALAAKLAAVFAQRAARDWERELTACDVACVEVAAGPVARAVMDDPISREAGFLVEVEHPTLGRHRRLGPTAILSETPGEARPAPLLGQHTESVLRELGFSEQEIDALERQQVIFRAPRERP